MGMELVQMQLLEEQFDTQQELEEENVLVGILCQLRILFQNLKKIYHFLMQKREYIEKK